MRTGSGLKAEEIITEMCKDRRGSILLEFTFTIGILAVIFMAMVIFSFLFADYYGAQKVAREGAREASLTKDTNRAGEKALQAAWLWGLDRSRVSVTFYQDETTVTCYVSYTATPFSKTFPKVLGGRPLGDYHMNAGATYVWHERR